MSLCVVVGGQFGSEGKGKVAAAIARRDNVDLAVRCGGPNSGHSFVLDGVTHLVRQLPTAFINLNTRLLIPAGATVDLTVLRGEIDTLGLTHARVGVDRNAMIIEEHDKQMERTVQLAERLSSTLCGVGAAVARRALRSNDVRLARDVAPEHPWLASMLTDVSAETNAALDADKKVLIEGTQGFGLSLFHSGFYPKTTSRDTSASAFLSEVGISPIRVTEIVLVLRTFPIRVAGAQAGPLNSEITWEQLRAESKSPVPILEFTTVTRRLRRLGRFDWDLAQRAVQVNRPTAIAINCLDYIAFENRGLLSTACLSLQAREFIARLERELRTKVGFVGTGPSLDDLFDPHMEADERLHKLVS